MMKFNRGHVVSVLVFTICTVCIFLAAALFYMMAPHLEITKSDKQAQVITDQILATTSADFAIFWHINLQTNSQRSISISTRKEENRNAALSVLTKLQQVKLSASHNPEELHALISGKSSCSGQMPTSTTLSADSKNYFQENANRYLCFVPVVNKSNSLVAKVTVVWQNKPDDEDIKSAIIQIRSITAE